MDVESPEHLERLRDLPEIKVALLRLGAGRGSSEARFERSPRNGAYWLPVERLSADFLAAGEPQETHATLEIYGRACWLIATLLAPARDAPFVIAIAAADGAPMETIVARLREVNRDYWYGSYFFK